MEKNKIYSYTAMEKKIRGFANEYSSDYYRLESLGMTYAKRSLYACHIGLEDAQYQFVITASIHGREYINTTLLLSMMEYYLERYRHSEHANEPCYQDQWRNICVTFIPMANPDGVAISMSTDAKRWKENGRGVDLNRNFPCGFGMSTDRKKRNPGESAADQLETQYLMQFIERLSKPLGVVHYHSRGNVIYFDYDVSGNLRNRIVRMASIAHHLTGYRMAESTKDTQPAGGFGDWCVYKKKIPSITIETGSIKTPVPKWQLNGICEKNLFLLRDLLAGIL